MSMLTQKIKSNMTYQIDRQVQYLALICEPQWKKRQIENIPTYDIYAKKLEKRYEMNTYVTLGKEITIILVMVVLR